LTIENGSPAERDNVDTTTIWHSQSSVGELYRYVLGAQEITHVRIEQALLQPGGWDFTRNRFRPATWYR